MISSQIEIFWNLKHSNACSAVSGMFQISNPCYMILTCVALLMVWRKYYWYGIPCMLSFGASNEFPSLIIFFPMVSVRFEQKWNFDNSISWPLRFFWYANHYTCMFHELNYHWCKEREINANHPAPTTSKQVRSPKYPWMVAFLDLPFLIFRKTSTLVFLFLNVGIREAYSSYYPSPPPLWNTFVFAYILIKHIFKF